MAYKKIGWKNEVPNGEPRYKIVEYDESVVAEGATIELINEVVPGTPINATNLNHMEEGIEQASKTADQALAAAQTAQGTANMARNEADAANAAAANAADAANAANTKALQAAAAASAAQTSANNALAAATARIPVINQNVRTSEFSTNSTSWQNVLSLALNMPSAGTILAFAGGTHRAETVYTGSELRIVIDGNTTGAVASKSCNDSTTDVSWTGFGLVEARAVGAGNHTITLQQRQGGAGAGTVYLQTANLVAIGFRS